MGLEEANKEGKKVSQIAYYDFFFFFGAEMKKIIVTFKLTYLIGFRFCATGLKMFTG